MVKLVNKSKTVSLPVREIWHRKRSPEEIAIVTPSGQVKFFTLSARYDDIEDSDDFLQGNGFRHWITMQKGVKVTVYEDD